MYIVNCDIELSSEIISYITPLWGC